MNATAEASPRSADLEQAIKENIVQRTGRRIRALEVEAGEHRVIVRGFAASFHLKQLAIQCVLEVLGDRGATAIEVDVQIVVGPRRSDADASAAQDL